MEKHRQKLVLVDALHTLCLGWVARAVELPQRSIHDLINILTPMLHLTPHHHILDQLQHQRLIPVVEGYTVHCSIQILHILGREARHHLPQSQIHLSLQSLHDLLFQVNGAQIDAHVRAEEDFVHQ